MATHSSVLAWRIPWTEELGGGGLQSKGSQRAGHDCSNLACMHGYCDASSIPGSGSSLGEGIGNPLQYSCLENPMDRGAWWAAVHVVTKSQTQLGAQTHTHMDIVDKIHCIGLVAVRLDYIRSPRPDLKLTLPLMA